MHQIYTVIEIYFLSKYMFNDHNSGQSKPLVPIWTNAKAPWRKFGNFRQ